MMDRKTKCLTCDREAVVRGLCSACHRAYHRAKLAGEITEDQAVEMGLLLPSRQGRRGTSQWRSAMESRMQEA